MIRQITGALLAILVVNPFCCCLGTVFSTPGSAEGTGTRSSDSHACCAGHETAHETPGSPIGHSDEDGPCDCDSHGPTQALLPEGKLTGKALPTLRDLESPLSGPRDCRAAPLSSLATPTLHPPVDPDDLPGHFAGGRSPGRFHAIVHGVFLI